MTAAAVKKAEENLAVALGVMIVEVVRGGDQIVGTPGGHLYAGVMNYCSLHAFERIMASLTKIGLVVKRGDCYHPGANLPSG